MVNYHNIWYFNSFRKSSSNFRYLLGRYLLNSCRLLWARIYSASYVSHFCPNPFVNKRLSLLISQPLATQKPTEKCLRRANAVRWIWWNCMFSQKALSLSSSLSFFSCIIAILVFLVLFSYWFWWVWNRMMSDYKVEMINDGMQEFFVDFNGPKESNSSEPIYMIDLSTELCVSLIEFYVILMFSVVGSIHFWLGICVLVCWPFEVALGLGVTFVSHI